jgi:hypothetical protein
MATNKQTAEKQAYLLRKMEEAKQHMEAALACVIGWKEAGSPKVYRSASGCFYTVNGVNHEAPASWHEASLCRLNYEWTQDKYNLWLSSRVMGRYYDANRFERIFHTNCAQTMIAAEKTIAAS